MILVKRCLTFAVAATLLAVIPAPAPADDSTPATGPAETKPTEEKPDATAEDLAVVEAVRHSLVRVQLEIQFDKGVSPYGFGWPFSSLSEPEAAVSIQEKRPIESPGFLLSPTRVIVPDMVLHSRFIKSLGVRFGDQVVPARIVGVAKRRSAMFLELEKPLTGATPLAFDATAEAPYKTVTYDRQSAYWTISVSALGGELLQRTDRPAYRVVPVGVLIVDAKGTPVGVSMDSDLAIDDSWKGSPLTWPTWSAKEIEAMLDTCKAAAATTVVRVQLSLRSPKKHPGINKPSSGGPTVYNVMGLMLDDRRVLVQGSMEPPLTARLEQIQVFVSDDKGLPAKFLLSLRDYGALVAELEKPIPGGKRLSDLLVREQLDEVLPAAEVKLRGEKRVSYFTRSRVVNLRRGWLDRIYPDLASMQGNLFLFDREGKLLGTSMLLRSRPGGPEARRFFTGVDLLKEIAADLQANADLSNVPVSGEKEDAIAWLGVLMQNMDKELARINGVSDLTADGKTGGLVSYVYPGSPAQRVGIKAGDVLLRIRVPDGTKPIAIRVTDYLWSRQPFPWEMLDRVPEHRFDEVPTPWAPMETPLTRLMTNIGPGKIVTFEVFSDGKVVDKPVTIELSPPHYLTAPRYKEARSGLTVADMTFEVRRYFQKTDKDPGVIVAKIEPGSRASIAGLKPFEVITHVNDRPVNNVKDFEQAVAKQDELRLEVKRMTRGRVVKIRMDAPAPVRPPLAPGQSNLYTPRTPAGTATAAAQLTSRCRCATMQHDTRRRNAIH